MSESKMLLGVGDVAPGFSLDSSKGGKYSLKDSLGKWVVLYFYPKDDTPGCTVEACNFRDSSKDYAAVGAEIYGVSVDSLKSHDKFVEKYHLPFPLLADTEKEVVEKYGVWKQKSMFGKKYMGIERVTFLIDPKGKIAQIWPKVKVANHHKEVLDFIKANS
ncbi:MAG: thioredoxin-dependent thiol peroxidase [Candidatus Altimarinota bacterium]